MCIRDSYATATSVVWDSTNEFSKCYIPWNNVTGLKPVLVIKGTAVAGALVESGFYTNPTVATDGSGTYFKVPKKNLTSVASDVIVGWRYDLDVILPKTYFRQDEEQKITDYTANLTINRMKFALGLSGVCGFKLKQTGRLAGSKEYTGDGSTTVFTWIDEDFNYVDEDQIKCSIDGVTTTAFTVSGDKQVTFNSAPGDTTKVKIYLDECEFYTINIPMWNVVGSLRTAFKRTDYKI